jgi:hypothetical protein
MLLLLILLLFTYTSQSYDLDGNTLLRLMCLRHRRYDERQTRGNTFQATRPKNK